MLRFEYGLLALATLWTVLHGAFPAVILGATVGQYVGATHVLIGYAALGVVLALRPHPTGARD
jgi:hypothetical protein